MAISRFKTSTLAQGLPKYQDIWDQVTLLLNLQAGSYLAANESGIQTNLQYFSVPSESVTTFANKLSTVTGLSGAVGNRRVAGYVQENAENNGDWTKINFSTQVASFVTGGVKTGGASVSNDGAAGYIGGGSFNSGYLSTISKMTYSTDTNSFASGNIYNTTEQNFGWSTGSGVGYFAGGHTGTGAAVYGSVSKYTYSGEGVSSMGNSITALRLGTSSSSSSSGYIFGGYNGGGSNVNIIQRWQYSNDTNNSVTATLSAARRETSSGGTYASIYVYSGTETASVKTIQKFITSTEAISTLGTSLAYVTTGGSNLAANNLGA